MDEVDLPQLYSISVKDDALYGDCSMACQMMSEAYNYKNTLTMRSGVERRSGPADLPSLAELKGGSCIFRFIGVVVLESGAGCRMAS